MESLKKLYKIGYGPSSSHTLAPALACQMYKDEFNQVDHVRVELYGSLSLTGKGHFTDYIIKKTFSPWRCEVQFKLDWNESFPNGFYIYGFDAESNLIQRWTVFSVGGGSIKILEKTNTDLKDPYQEKNMSEIMEVCTQRNMSFFDYVLEKEPDIENYLSKILDAMLNSVEIGLQASGVLPGKLQMERSAKSIYLKSKTVDDEMESIRLRQIAYAYATSEQNASVQTVVTAPTLGSCGIMAGMMYYYYNDVQISRQRLIKALAVGGLFGNVIKTNATISGAVGGCQAEVGAACCMAAAASAYLNDLSLKQIEYAAEIAMEHHLGLTCDPVGGYVIIPCIERNGVALLRAFDAMLLAKYMGKIKENRVRFDMVVNTMSYTGQKLPLELKETSLGGLALEIKVLDDSADEGA